MVYAMAEPTHLYIKLLNAYLTILCYFAVSCLGQSPLRNSLFSQKQKNYWDIIVMLMLFSLSSNF